MNFISIKLNLNILVNHILLCMVVRPKQFRIKQQYDGITSMNYYELHVCVFSG